MGSLFKMAIRNLKKQRRRTAAIFAAVFASIFLLHTYEALLDGMASSQFNRAFREDGHLMLVKPGYHEKSELFPLYLAIDQAQDKRLALQQWLPHAKIKSELPFSALLSFDEQSEPTQIIGFEPNATPYQEIQEHLIKGRMITGENEILLGYRLASKLGAGIGDHIIVLANDSYDSLSAAKAEIVGIMQTHIKIKDERRAYLHLSLAQNLLKMPSQASKLIIQLDDVKNTDTVLKTLKEKTDHWNLEWIHWHKLHPEILYFNHASNIAFGIFSFIILVVASTGIINTILMSIFERITELGTLRALGYHRGQIAGIILMEVTIIAATAASFALIFGALFSLYFAKTGINIGEIAESVDGFSRIVYTKTSWPTVIKQFMIGICISIVGSLYPLYRALNMEIVKTLAKR